MRFSLLLLLFFISHQSFSQLNKEVDVSAYMQPYKVRTGYIDNDSIMDVVMGSSYSPATSSSTTMRIMWAKMDSSGRVISRNVIDSLSCKELIVTDIDNDSDDDIITISSILYSNDIVIYENLGCGEFSNATVIDSGYVFKTFTTGDINGDGYVDIAAVLLNDLVVLMNDGNGNFTSSTTVVSGGLSNQELQCSDIDGNGRDDITYLESGPQYGGIHYVLSNSNGTFSTVNTIDFPNPIYVVEYQISDFDNDGDKDFVARRNVNTHQEFYLASNTNMSFSIDTLLTVANCLVFRIEDYDGNGHKDLVTARDSVNVYLNDGSQNFQFEFVTTSVSILSNSHPLVIEDLDYDGHLDLIVDKTTSSSSGLKIIPNSLFGSSFPNVRINWQANYNDRCLAIGDLNHDGLEDIVVSAYSDNRTYVHFQDTLGHFLTPTLISTWGWSEDSEIGGIFDVDNNGLNDLLVHTGSSLAYLEYTGTQWQMSLISGTPSTPRAVDVMDYDNDGDMDLALLVDLGANGVGLSVLANDGSGSFSSVHYEVLPVNITTQCVLFADANNDATTDVLFSESSTFNNLNYISYIPGNSGNTFDPIVRIDSVDHVENFVQDDLDGNGILDIIVAGGDLTALYQSGSGSYSKTVMSTVGNLNAQWVVSGDLDNDNDADLYVAAFNDLHCFEQTSPSNFNNYKFAWSEQVRIMRLADVNNDAEMELITLAQSEKLAYYTDSLLFDCSIVQDTASISTNEFEFLNGTKEILIYPNPNTGEFTVAFTSNKKGTLRVYDLLGKLVSQEDVDGLEVQMELKVESGQYIVVMKENHSGKYHIQKIVVQ